MWVGGKDRSRKSGARGGAGEGQEWGKEGKGEKDRSRAGVGIGSGEAGKRGRSSEGRVGPAPG